MNSLWSFNKEQTPLAEQVLQKFVNENGHINYDKFKTEGKEIFDVLSVGRNHTQLQQSFSKLRSKLGMTAQRFGGRQKKSHDTESFPRSMAKITRKYTKRVKKQPEPEAKIEAKTSLHFCPGCGINLDAYHAADKITKGS